MKILKKFKSFLQKIKFKNKSKFQLKMENSTKSVFC